MTVLSWRCDLGFVWNNEDNVFGFKQCDQNLVCLKQWGHWSILNSEVTVILYSLEQ